MRVSTVLPLLVGFVMSTVLFTEPVAAATPRAVVRVEGPMVRLSDLFTGLDAGQDCVLGDAPRPGSRIVIEQPQLEAIASQFGVGWEPAGNGQTVVLDRAGRTVARAAIVTILEKALADRYGTPHIAVTLSSYEEATVDLEATLGVVDLATEPSDGQFQAMLVASLHGTETMRIPVSGRVERLLTLPVPSRPISSGQAISDQDLVLVDIPADRVMGDVIDKQGQGIGLIAIRPLPAGWPIPRSDLRRPDYVFRDTPVLMRLASNGIDVEAQGQALESGTLDERVRVLNPVSHAILLATVTGQNAVRVDADDLPLVEGGASGPGRVRFGEFGSSYARVARVIGSDGEQP